jgi:endonuclease/exonuclease/phosphatase family metal-dependent hydrolase
MEVSPMKNTTFTHARNKEEGPRRGRAVFVLLLAALMLITSLPASAEHPGHPGPPVRVMTRNLYLGADIFDVVNLADPTLIPFAVAEKYAVMKQNDFAERARAIAMEISDKQPDLIGCQEVATFTRLQLTGDPAAPLRPVERYDYLQLLLDALQADGLEYEVAATGDNADVTMPMLSGSDASGSPILELVNYLDRDVILARKGIATGRPEAHSFSKNFAVALPGADPIVFKRGFVAVNASVRGKSFRFVNAHVENEGLPAPDGTLAQTAQVSELLQELSQVNLPVLLVGDFNLPPTDTDYATIVNAGFADLWALRTNGRHKNGSTCCQDEDLLNEESNLTERIDYIFVRSGDRHGVSHLRPPVIVQLTGDDADEDRTEFGLWPSDHAGVFAAIRLRTDRH